MLSADTRYIFLCFSAMTGQKLWLNQVKCGITKLITIPPAIGQNGLILFYLLHIYDMKHTLFQKCFTLRLSYDNKQAKASICHMEPVLSVEHNEMASWWLWPCWQCNCKVPDLYDNHTQFLHRVYNAFKQSRAVPPAPELSTVSNVLPDMSTSTSVLF